MVSKMALYSNLRSLHIRFLSVHSMGEERLKEKGAVAQLTVLSLSVRACAFLEIPKMRDHLN